MATARTPRNPKLFDQHYRAPITLNQLLEGIVQAHRTNSLPRGIHSVHQAIHLLHDPQERKVAGEFLRDLELQQSGFREPFGKPKTPEDLLKHYALPTTKEASEVATRLNDALTEEYVTAGVIERLGGPDNAREPEPVSLRDQVSAAVDLHTEGT